MRRNRVFHEHPLGPREIRGPQRGETAPARVGKERPQSRRLPHCGRELDSSVMGTGSGGAPHGEAIGRGMAQSAQLHTGAPTMGSTRCQTHES